MRTCGASEVATLDAEQQDFDPETTHIKPLVHCHDEVFARAATSDVRGKYEQSISVERLGV